MSLMRQGNMHTHRAKRVHYMYTCNVGASNFRFLLVETKKQNCFRTDYDNSIRRVTIQLLC